MLEATALLLALSMAATSTPAQVQEIPPAIVETVQQVEEQIIIETTPEPEPVPEPTPTPTPEPKPDLAPVKPYVAPYGKVLGTYTTKAKWGQTNRNTNIRLACEAINEYVVQPGAQFSFNTVVGQRTKERGYKEAGVYVNGQVDTGVGGGICQVSSTLFNAALLSNMTITARRAHSLPVSYLPRGRDAAVSWGGPEFKFKNPYSFPVMICTYFNPNTCEIVISIKGRADATAPNVKISVTEKNGTYTTTRTVDGKVNYTTTSKYGS